MQERAIVFAVCKEVRLQESRQGENLIAVSLAPVCTPHGAVDRTRPLVLYFKIGRREASLALDRLIHLMADTAARGLLSWGSSSAEDRKGRAEAACLNRCVWLSVSFADGTTKYPLINPLSPEEAGAALRGGHL